MPQSFLKYFITTTLLHFVCFSNVSAQVTDKYPYTSYVDPFLGNVIGNTLPGPTTPFGMVKLGPDILPPNNTTGYKPDKNIIGFSHNHLSGTGGGARYGNIQVIPQVGPVNLFDAVSTKYNEYAKPGYYTVSQSKKYGDIKAELTTTDHAGFHRYSFFVYDKPDTREAYIFGHTKPQVIDANILIDATTIINSKSYELGYCTGAEVEIKGRNRIEGCADFKGGWGGDNPYRVYFIALFDKAFNEYGTWNKKEIFQSSLKQKGNDIGAYAGFKVQQGEQVQLKVSISYCSRANAEKNMNEITGWDFDLIRKKANDTWNRYLSKIKIDGATEEQKTIFYSALYHTIIMPAKLECNPGWASKIAHSWDFYTLWDTYRTVMPLYTLILPDKQTELINTLLDIYEHKGWLPDAWTAGDYAMIQGGTSADVVIADAAVKGLKNIDYNKAYNAIRKNATTASDNPFKYGRYGEYFELGYCSDNVKNGSSKTLEYAYNDFCVAQVAKTLNKTLDYKRFLKQSENCYNLFNNETKFFWGKTRSGSWVPEFSPTFRRPDYWNGPYFYEGTPYSYSFYVPHDVHGLIKRQGGNDKFNAFLDTLFIQKHFELGNEPGFLTPYLYIYSGRHDKTAEVVRDLLNHFKVGNTGLPGQDDSGAMSAWYIFSAMGFFPVAGQDIYLIGSPLFPYSEINLGDNKKLKVIAHDVSPSNKYIKKAVLNKSVIDRAWFRHGEIKNGGTLELFMTDKPVKWGKLALPNPLHNDNKQFNEI